MLIKNGSNRIFKGTQRVKKIYKGANLVWIDEPPNLLEGITTYADKTVNTDGTLVSNPGFTATDFIPVIAGKTYIFTQTVNDYLRYAWFNANKTLLSRPSPPLGLSITLTVPTGASYIRVSYTSKSTTTTLKEQY